MILTLNLLLSVLVGVPASAQPAASPHPVTVDQVVDVHRSADLTSPVVQRLRPGDALWILGEDSGVARVRYRRGRGWRTGFIRVDRFESDRPAARAPGDWRAGVALVYSVLSQGGRRFQTQDQVNWTTSQYASQTIWPTLYGEWGRTNFWRAGLGIRRVDFQGHAVADVNSNYTRSIEVIQNMISARLERAWRLLDPAYLIIGGEVARALVLTERISGIQVPTTSDDIRTYAGGSIGVGAKIAITTRVRGFAEARAGVYPTLSPVAYVFEGAAGAGWAF